MAIKKEENLSKEKLLGEIERLKKELKKRKKYGLVWEEKPEEVVDMCKEKLPILKEVKSKEIITDPDKPVNLLIEGDNYHALSVLNYTHAKKVDVIYIDPPYNIGNKDFKYNDVWVDSEDSFKHSKWISFIHKRLKLAKNLLTESGVIFASIGDQEVHNLRHICDEIFGENSIGQFIRQGVKGGTRAQSLIATNHDYVLVYAKNKKTAELLGKKVESLSLDLEDKKGKYRKGRELNKWGAGSRREDAQKMWFPIPGPNGEEVYPIRNDGSDGRWRWGKKKLLDAVKNNNVIFEKRKNGTYIVYEKVRTEGEREIAHASIMIDSAFSNAAGTEELKGMFGGKSPFSYPKPTFLIEYLVSMIENKNAIVLDFFAGSGTTGQAVLQLNERDSGTRRIILCTNNEENICTDVCYPRIEKVINGYKNSKGERVEDLGGNLKYFKTDFVNAEPTDRNKKKLTEQATEMLCVREGTFETVLEQKRFKIYKKNNHYTGIIFDQLAIPDFKKAIKDIKGKFSVYVFSLGDDTFDEEFEGIKQKVKLSPIPEAILRVYRRIFK